jgi:hypothetical protein
VYARAERGLLLGIAAITGIGIASGCSEAPATATSPIDTQAGTSGAAGAAGRSGAGDAGAAGSAGAAGTAGTNSNPDAAGSGGSGQDAGQCSGDCPDAAVATDGATSDGAAADAGACTPCTSYAEPTVHAELQVTALSALSGIAASWRNPGVLFAHNDRARADVYALAPDGSLRAQYSLPGAEPIDVEDIAVGPCPTGTCLYLADVGGNVSQRTEYAILRTEEPSVPSSGTAEPSAVAFDRLRFEYDDAANRNAEGLLVDPTTGAIYVVTKVADGQPSDVYALPDPPLTDALNVATKVADLPVPRAGDMAASAAAAHPCGTGFLIRTYNAVYEFRIPAGAPFADAFAVAPATVPAASETQSEGISYLPDGRGYLSSGEGEGAPIYQTLCL